MKTRYVRGGLLLAALLAGGILGTGCEDDDGYRDHNPPPGQGSLVIDNRTGDDVEVYIDGEYIRKVSAGSDRIVDLDPGLYRLVLNNDDGPGAYGADTDILQDRLTILRVYSEFYGAERYTVYIEFD